MADQKKDDGGGGQTAQRAVRRIRPAESGSLTATRLTSKTVGSVKSNNFGIGLMQR